MSTVRLVLDTPLAASLDCEAIPMWRLDGEAHVVDPLRVADADAPARSNGSRLLQARVALEQETARHWSTV